MNNATIEKIAKELCEKSHCHHKCHDTKDCVVEDEAKEVIANSATTTEKQIEEMAKKLCVAKICHEKKRANCIGLGDCHKSREVAEALYNAGYRKQSEGEWKIMKMGDGGRVRTCSSCLISQSVNVYKGKVMFRYCPYCGAKMKGGN